LPGVIQAGLPNPPTLDLALGVEVLLAGDVTPTGGGEAHTAQVVTVQVGHGIGAAVPHRYGATTKGVILFLDPGAVLFPLPQVEGGDAVPSAVDPVGVSIIAILLVHPINSGDAAGFVVVVPGVAAVVPTCQVAVGIISAVYSRY